MGLFQPGDDSVHLKVVYYGPAFGGKTTNLAWVKALLDPDAAHGLLSVDTGDDSTLFFDHLPLRFRLLERYSVSIQGYTVPGQVGYHGTRRLVLGGADAVVFVADSRRERMAENRASLDDLRSNLRAVGLPASVPIVMQWNQRDRDSAVECALLERELNAERRPSVAAVGVRGEGVLETLRVALTAAWRNVHVEFGFARRGLSLESALDALQQALDGAASPRAAAQAVHTGRVHVRVGPERAAELPPERLLASAVSAGLELAALSGRLAGERDDAAARIAALMIAGQRLTHDLRKPLCALKNALHLLAAERTRLQRPAALDLARDVLEEMVRQLSVTALRFETAAAPGPIEARRFSLSDVVESVLRQFSYAAADAGIELRAIGDLPDVVASREALLSILSNLVGNAIRYHDPAKARRSVIVEGRRTRHGWILAVCDNGRGIPHCDRGAVFERNVRGSTSRGTGGTGLGLHLVREQARALRARIGLLSREGVGSTFYCVLPVSMVVDAEAPSASARVSSARSRAAP